MIKLDSPNHKVVFLVMDYCKFVLKDNPYIDEVITFDLTNRSILSIKLLKSAIKLLIKLRHSKFDYAVLLHNSTLLSLLLYFSGIKTRVGLDKNKSYS